MLTKRLNRKTHRAALYVATPGVLRVRIGKLVIHARVSVMAPDVSMSHIAATRGRALFTVTERERTQPWVDGR
jgi:hypothetical protein